MLLLCLLLACKSDDPPESGDTACTLYCPDLDGDGLGDLVWAECWPRCLTHPPYRAECNFTTNCPE